MARVKAVRKVRIDQPEKPLRHLFLPLANNSRTVITRWQIIVQTMKRVFQDGHEHTSGMNVLRNTSLHTGVHSPVVFGRFLRDWTCSPEYLWTCRLTSRSSLGGGVKKRKKKKKSQYSFFFLALFTQFCFHPGSFKNLINYELIN